MKSGKEEIKSMMNKYFQNISSVLFSKDQFRGAKKLSPVEDSCQHN